MSSASTKKLLAHEGFQLFLAYATIPTSISTYISTITSNYNEKLINEKIRCNEKISELQEHNLRILEEKMEIKQQTRKRFFI